MRTAASNYKWDAGQTFVDAYGQSWLVLPDDDRHHLFECAVAYKGKRLGVITHLSKIDIHVALDEGEYHSGWRKDEV